MQTAQKDLPAVNDEIRLDNPSDSPAYIGFQYISGAGTVVVEASGDGGTTWFACLLTSMTTAATTAAAFTAAGGWYAIVPFNLVRVKKTVGVASCVVSLTLAPFTPLSS